MRLLICGGRDFNNTGAMHRWIDHLFVAAARSEFLILQDGGPGAAKLAHDWAGEHGVRLLAFDGAPILSDGKPDLVLAFPGGRETADLVQRAEIAGVKVVRVLPSAAMAPGAEGMRDG